MTFSQPWKKFALRRKERLVTTWKLRIIVVVCGTALLWGTRAFWIPVTAQSLVCSQDVRQSDLIVVDNSDQDYLAFEKAAELRKAGIAHRVAVPIPSDPHNPDAAHPMFAEFVSVMARVAWLGDFEMIPVTQQEPITLNVAYRVRDYVIRRQLRSMIISVPAFRSRRTMLIYKAVMRDTGVSVRCLPVFGRTTNDNWTDTWHGIEGVGEQLLKLQYYRLAVLPFMRSRPAPISTASAPH